MESVQSWLVKWRKDTDDFDHTRAIEALALLLDDKTSPLDTAKSITTIYEPSLKSPEPRPDSLYYNKVCVFWALYMPDAIQTFGSVEVHKRLFDMLFEISKQPDVLDDDGEPLVAYTPDRAYWSDLPGFSRFFVMDGLYIQYIEEFWDSERDKFLAQIPGHLNAVRFAAMVLQNGLAAVAFPLEAACALNIGLEHEYDERSKLFVGVGLDKDNWPVLIPVAGIWLLVAGRQIYDHCISGDTSHGWGGGRWNMDSWALWKVQLGKFAKRGDFSEDCRDFAAEALRKMIEIETEGEHQD